ncbi:MAG: inositol monophosphatase [Rhodospirillaceae bacterium]|jgi:fructose-1,6-bisphosphatase/inositol monophosphatase family enzyme|nr:inositol monophosphatase [Rhodospirillaceae bacterium]
MRLDPQRVASVMREIAQEELLPRFKTLARNDVWEKERGGTVTVADLESERRLQQALTDLVPGSLVLAEEDAEENPEAIQYLNQAAPVWIVDPLDGTKNFAAGKDQYAMIVAYYDRGAVRAGWILSPSTGHMAMAEEGAGAWSDDGPLKAASPTPLGETTGFLGNRIRKIEGVAGRFGDLVNHRCRGYEYVALASGDLHFAHYRSLKAWDHAAGDLIVREAGGHVAGFDSEALYEPANPDYNGLLVASDEASWNEIVEILRPAVATLD